MYHNWITTRSSSPSRGTRSGNVGVQYSSEMDWWTTLPTGPLSSSLAPVEWRVLRSWRASVHLVRHVEGLLRQGRGRHAVIPNSGVLYDPVWWRCHLVPKLRGRRYAHATNAHSAIRLESRHGVSDLAQGHPCVAQTHQLCVRRKSATHKRRCWVCLQESRMGAPKTSICLSHLASRLINLFVITCRIWKCFVLVKLACISNSMCIYSCIFLNVFNYNGNRICTCCD